MSSLPEIGRSRSVSQPSHRRTRPRKSPHRSLDRVDAVARAERMVRAMPAEYLRSKAELRVYLLARACELLLRPLLRRYTAMLSRAFRTWRTPPVIQLNEKQFGLLVISKALLNLLDRCTQRAFTHWARLCSSRLNPRPVDASTAAALTLQRWYRFRRSRLRQVLSSWETLAQEGLRRHRLRQRFLLLERRRFQALQKMRMGIAFRRRFYLACRTIQRGWRWVRRWRRVRRRLRRVCHSRLIQRWWGIIFMLQYQRTHLESTTYFSFFRGS